MGGPKLTLFVDIVSPFSYLAFYMVKNSPIFKECEVTYVPILLGGLFKACGNTAPLNIKNKDKWINIERKRWARLFTVPMIDEPPKDFPPSTVGVQRVLCALEQTAPETLPDTLSALYDTYWVQGKPISKPEAFQPVISSVLGEEKTRDIIEKSTSKDGKERLNKNTELAFQEGAFGLPWFIATNSRGEEERYWGFDHIGQVVNHLGLEKPKAGSHGEGGWRAML